MAESVEKAYLAIRTDIVAGVLGIGAHLRAEPLAERLGLSRTPVREALRRLHAEGLVDIVPNYGAYVRGWTRRDMEEVFELRIRLESYAAEMGAASLSESDIEVLDGLDQQMRAAAASGAPDRLNQIKELNARFHRIIIEGSMNRRLAAMMSSVVETHLIARTFHSYSPDDLKRSMQHHSELVAAFRARDALWASCVMQSHLRAARQAMLSAADAAEPAVR
jgi:DNA-binding GntR family transcriptional regulator